LIATSRGLTFYQVEQYQEDHIITFFAEAGQAPIRRAANRQVEMWPEGQTMIRLSLEIQTHLRKRLD
jgi:hypothetical protein